MKNEPEIIRYNLILLVKLSKLKESWKQNTSLEGAILK